ncbi:MAG TPA: response regulator [Chitinophagaceae bacterium]|nr:response regulator [Chitinophagaceae bacterium]
MKQIDILLVEDNEGDIILTLEAFEEWNTANHITVAKDGQAAIDFFSNENKHTVLPDLILLDINLPKKNGHEVLKFIKSEEKLKHIPVIMLTTSSSAADVKLAYNNYANCYITKPDEVDTFLKVVSAIENFWITIVKLPLNTITS